MANSRKKSPDTPARAPADPLAGVRIAAPKTAPVAAPAETGTTPTPPPEEPVEDATEVAAAKKALRDEKKLVTAPAKATAPKIPEYLVQRDQRVFWRGQQLRLRGGVSIVSDRKFGAGGVEAFRNMGVSLKLKED